MIRGGGGGRTPAVTLVLGALLGVSGCEKERVVEDPPPVFAGEIGTLFAARCSKCHEGPAPAGGFRTGSYLDAIGCGNSGSAAIVAGTEGYPLLRTLDDETHRALLVPSERRAVEAWLVAGSSSSRGGVHGPGIIDPRSPEFHGRALRAELYRPMLDATSDRACGRCHDGANDSRPAGVTFAAPGAPSCTSCHEQARGTLACSTCHGEGVRASPPRDACFFPDEAARAGAHAAHVSPSTARSTAIPCATCHPLPGARVIDGRHGDGKVDVELDGTRIGPEAEYDPDTSRCAVTCHHRQDGPGNIAWSDPTPLACNGCHGAPPNDHPPGACTTCHREADATGTHLSGGPLHMNGRVDLGDGSPGCGTCHGLDDDPWPSTAAHRSHERPTLTDPVDCGSCHPVPGTLQATGHMNGTVDIVFSGRARDRGADPIWDGTSCADVACHGAKLEGAPAMPPVWTDPSGKAAECGACHGLPPPQHTPSTSCDRSDCHGDEVRRTGSSLWITPFGRGLHVDGTIQHNR
jgi:predicted CxxxxCH...CXXCH cytochrome family protein